MCSNRISYQRLIPTSRLARVREAVWVETRLSAENEHSRTKEAHYAEHDAAP